MGVLVNWKKPGAISLHLKDKEKKLAAEVHLHNGVNEVSDSDWALAKAHPTVKKLLDEKSLVELSQKPAAGKDKGEHQKAKAEAKATEAKPEAKAEEKASK